MDLFKEIRDQIAKAEEEAIVKEIKTNAIILNEDFDYVKELYPMLHLKTGENGGIHKTMHIPPMICGKYVFVGKLPKDYSFVLTNVNEEMFQSEVDYWKHKCEKLAEKLSAVKEALGFENGEE